MDSFSRKIFFSLALSLAFFTAVAVIWLPKYLEQSEGNPIKTLEGAPQVPFAEDELSQAVTRFPTRAFGTRPNTSKEPANGTTQEAEHSTGPGGLPTRFVPGVDNAEALGERVTTRAYIRADSSVFSRPSMTAEVLGRVDSQTKVRWLAKASDGWEEILLKNGNSAFVQSSSMSFSADTWSTHQKGFQSNGPANGAPDPALLPGTIETFLTHLSAADLLRAETFLSPVASRLDQANLGQLQHYVGAPPLGRVLRIELISGDRSSYRRVRIVYGPDMLHEATTVWEWDLGQQRWMLVRWG